MDVRFMGSVAVISPDSSASRGLYVNALGLPLAGEPDGYLHSEDIDGSKSFGVWPLNQAAEACFGTPEWPAARPVPQASIEFEVADADSVQVAAEELTPEGVHPAPRGACPAVGADRRSTPITRGSDHRRLVRARAAAVARNTVRPEAAGMRAVR
jgi:catechol 2,3-dioxygenase-like lactoylglutathione lyase family enzyme